jgi:hypothetical protein
MKENRVINITDRRMKENCWINVPINADKTTFKKTAKDWLGEAVKHNGSKVGEDEAARRACSYLASHYPEPVIAALKEKKFPVVDPMNETRMAAMYEEAGISQRQEEVISKH